MTFAFVKYWVEGEQEAIQTLFEAIKNGEGWAEKSLKNLGVNTENYETGRVEWCNPELIEKDGQKVLYFEEYYPYERGLLIDQLFEEEKFAGKLTHLYYYVEEGANAELFATNDDEGKYFPYRLVAHVVDNDGFCSDSFYAKDEEQLIHDIREKYQLSDEYNDIDSLQQYFEDSEDYDYLYGNDIQVLAHPFVNWK